MKIKSILSSDRHYNQSHYEEVLQGAMFMEWIMLFGLMLYWRHLLEQLLYNDFDYKRSILFPFLSKKPVLYYLLQNQNKEIIFGLGINIKGMTLLTVNTLEQ